MLNKFYLQSKKYIYKISMNKPGKKIAVAPQNLQYFTEWQKEDWMEKYTMIFQLDIHHSQNNFINVL